MKNDRINADESLSLAQNAETVASPTSHFADRRCYSVDDVCAIMGVSRNYVYALLKSNTFRWFRLGNTGRYRISKVDFDAWLDSSL